MLVFDGAMAEPRVLVNGKYAGYWAYGYNSFRLDVTRLLRKGDNTIEVHLQMSKRAAVGILAQACSAP